MENNELYPEGIVHQTEDFAIRQKIKKFVGENVEEIIKEETIKAFEKLGYEENEGYLFIVAAGGKNNKEKEIGKSTKEGKLVVTVSVPKMLNMGAVKPVSYMQKVTTFGGKKLVSEIYMEIRDKTVHIEYKNTEAASFSQSSEKDTYAPHKLNKSAVISGLENEKTFKKDFANFFEPIAEAEAIYLVGTKIAVDDKVERNMNDSIVKENKNIMKLVDLFSSSFEEAGNQIDNLVKESLEIKDAEYKEKEDSAVGTPSTSSGKPTDKKLVIGSEDKTEEEKNEETVDEMTASGGNAAGGAYLTPHAFTSNGKTKAFKTNKSLGYTEVQMNESVKDTTYGQMRTPRAHKVRQEDGSYKIITEGSAKTPYVDVVPMGPDGWPPKGMEHPYALGKHGIKVNSPEELAETGHGDLSQLEKENLKENNYLLKETGEWDDSDEEMIKWKEYLKNEINKITNEFPDRVELISVKGFDKYQGPYANVKINDINYTIWTIGEMGNLWIDGFPVDNTSDAGANPGYMGNTGNIINMLKNRFSELNESLKLNLVKRKFISLTENEEKGINKRYIITEKLSKEEQVKRWKKLYENDCFCGIKDQGDDITTRGEYEEEANKEFSANNSIESDLCNTPFSGEEKGFVDVPKTKGSMIVFRISESDVKANKMYLIDHFTKKLVLNPLYKSKG
jgi:hypothetical protein